MVTTSPDSASSQPLSQLRRPLQDRPRVASAGGFLLFSFYRSIIWQRGKVGATQRQVCPPPPPQRPELVPPADENLFPSALQAEQLLPLNISSSKCKSGVQ